MARVRARETRAGLKREARLPIIAVTGGFAIKEIYDPFGNSIKLGANAMLRKPVDIDTLRRAVNLMLPRDKRPTQSKKLASDL